MKRTRFRSGLCGALLLLPAFALDGTSPEEAHRNLFPPDWDERTERHQQRTAQERAARRENQAAILREQAEKRAAAEAAWEQRVNEAVRQDRQGRATAGAPIYGLVERPELSDEPIPVYRWPRQRPLPAEVSVRGHNSDGVTFPYTHLKLPAFHYAAPRLEGWSLSDRRSDTSFTLRHNLYPSLNFSLFAFRPDTFLPLLSERHLLGYALGLERLYGEEFQAENLTDILESAPFTLAQNDVHHFAYARLIPREDPTAEPFRHAQEDFLTVLPQGCFIFRLEGPADQLERVRTQITAFLEGLIHAEILAANSL